MELSGGQFLTPVQTLVATLIFAEGKNANRVRPQFSSIFPIAKSMFFCYNVKYMIVNRDERKEQPLCDLKNE
jgi:hypothetical protein